MNQNHNNQEVGIGNNFLEIIKNTQEHLKLAKVNKNNKEILFNLAQSYEAEFSSITGKMPDKNGIFKLDTKMTKPYSGYLLYYQKIPVGFCILNSKSNPKDIAEFYIIPSMRRKKLGEWFAEYIFAKYPGDWQVRQIQGADHAIRFWRKVISKHTQGNYQEMIVEDVDWGMVTKQIFVSN